MKILMVSSFLPFPLYSGGHVRLFNLIKELSQKHGVTLICEKRSIQTEEDIKELEKICKKVITVTRGKQWSINNIVNSGISSKSFLTTGHTSREMERIIKNELDHNSYDLIHVETFYVMQNLPDTSLPIVLAEHNIEYDVYKRYAQSSPLALRPLLNLDIAKIRKEEEASWKRATKLVTVSKDDNIIMKKTGVAPVIVANGVDTAKFAYKNKLKGGEDDSKKILFLGDFKWIQNRDSARFIIEEIWPEIRSKIKDQRSKISFWIVGRSIPDSIRNLTTDPNVIFDEDSSSRPTEEIFQSADVLLAPIRVGGGTSYKILESMSCGTPVITMPLSAESIEAIDNSEIMIGKTAAELAEKTIELIQNELLYKRLSVNGRKLIEQKYSWDKIAKKLDNVYQSVV